jgi:hypothetical protein
LIERFQDFIVWSGKDTSKVNTHQIGVAKVGTLRSGIKVFRDTFAGGNYALLDASAWSVAVTVKYPPALKVTSST